MAYKRRRSSRKFKRRPTRRRRMYRSKKKKKMNTNYMVVKMTTRPDDLTNSNLTEATDGYRFRLDGLDNYAHYRAQWDQYKILKVRVTWTPIRTQGVTMDVHNVSPATTTNVPMVYTAIDRDNITGITVQDVKERYGSRRFPATRSHSRTLVPSLLQVCSAVGGAGYITKTKQWIDSSYPDVEHYGIRAAMEPAEPAGAYRLQVNFNVWVAFRNRMI